MTTEDIIFSRILALAPDTLEEYIDWVKIEAVIGQPNGVFLSKYPKKWQKKFLEFIESAKLNTNLSQAEIIKLTELLKSQEVQKIFISLENTGWNDQISWEENFNINIKEQKKNLIPIGKRNSNIFSTTIDKLQISEVIPNSSISNWYPENFGKSGVKIMAHHLAPYLLNTEKIAFIDRYNSLETKNKEPTTLVNLIIELLKIKQLKNSSLLSEILIFSKHENAQNFKNKTETDNCLRKYFSQIKTPNEGINFICIDEENAKEKGRDLHARLIVTNDVAFQLTDSIANPHVNPSQAITRLNDKKHHYDLKNKWLEWVDWSNPNEINKEASIMFTCNFKNSIRGN